MPSPSRPPRLALRSGGPPPSPPGARARRSAWLRAARDRLLARLRAGGLPGPFRRFLLPFLAVAAAALLPLASRTPPGHLDVEVGAAFAAGALFGPAGVLAAALGALAPLLVVPSHGLPPLLLGAAANLSVAALAWLVFRYGDGVGRALPDLPSYLAAVGGGAVGSLVAAPLLALATPGRDYLPALGLQAVGALSGCVLLGVPLVLAGRSYLAGRCAPVPAERVPPPARQLGDGPAEDVGEATLGGTRTSFDSAPGGEATRLVRPARSQAGRGVALGAAMILLITLLAVPVAVLVEHGDFWVVLFYLAPVIWGARLYGLRGGVATASAAALAYLLVSWLVVLAYRDVGYHPLSLYAQLLLLSPVGAYLGQARDREVRLRRELVTHSRLMRQDLLRVVRALTAAIEAKDAYTESHLRRVGDYAVEVGARLGLKGRELEILYYAAMLHDVGKIGVPESVLRKPGPLDDEEAALMRLHPEIGARIVSGLDLLNEAAPLILHHQERWDGGDGGGYPGYPAGLRGGQIPLGARIIAVVDTYDAMTTSRPYREALPASEAVAELEREAGRQFDPAVVEAFLEVLRDRPWVE